MNRRSLLGRLCGAVAGLFGVGAVAQGSIPKVGGPYPITLEELLVMKQAIDRAYQTRIRKNGKNNMICYHSITLEMEMRR